MHAAVVGGGLDVIGHGRRLWILSQSGIVVGGSGMQHVAQTDALHPGQQQIAADQPIAASVAFWRAWYWATKMPKTSARDSFKAPDWPE